jgi:SHS2 domain-containing protein
MTKRFEFIEDLTSDVLFRANGKSLQELFENAALALFTIICEQDKVRPEECIEVSVSAENPEELLYEWLSRLLAEHEINGLFFCKFNIELVEDKLLYAKVWGSEADPSIGAVQVKAITLYKFGLEKTKKGFEATVSCDI